MSTDPKSICVTPNWCQLRDGSHVTGEKWERQGHGGSASSRWQGHLHRPSKSLKNVGRGVVGVGWMGKVPAAESREELLECRIELPVKVGSGTRDEALDALRVDDDEAVGMVDVIGERLAGPPVDCGRLVLGNLLSRRSRNTCRWCPARLGSP